MVEMVPGLEVVEVVPGSEVMEVVEVVPGSAVVEVVEVVPGSAVVEVVPVLEVVSWPAVVGTEVKYVPGSCLEETKVCLIVSSSGDGGVQSPYQALWGQ